MQLSSRSQLATERSWTGLAWFHVWKTPVFVYKETSIFQVITGPHTFCHPHLPQHAVKLAGHNPPAPTFLTVLKAVSLQGLPHPLVCHLSFTSSQRAVKLFLTVSSKPQCEFSVAKPSSKAKAIMSEGNLGTAGYHKVWSCPLTASLYYCCLAPGWSVTTERRERTEQQLSCCSPQSNDGSTNRLWEQDVRKRHTIPSGSSQSCLASSLHKICPFRKNKK